MLVALNLAEVVLLLAVVVAVGVALWRQSRQLDALLDLLELHDEDSRAVKRDKQAQDDRTRVGA